MRASSWASPVPAILAVSLCACTVTPTAPVGASLGAGSGAPLPLPSQGTTASAPPTVDLSWPGVAPSSVGSGPARVTMESLGALPPPSSTARSASAAASGSRFAPTLGPEDEGDSSESGSASHPSPMADGVASGRPVAGKGPATPATNAGGGDDLGEPAFPEDGVPRLGATVIAATVYKEPNRNAKKLGYLRLGAIVKRESSPARGGDCRGKWYRVEPEGYVCTEEASTDPQEPILRATRVRPRLDRPLPYVYGFVRATAPQYLRVPTRKEQLDAEFKLMEHLGWYEQNQNEVQFVSIGANDVPLDPRGIARLGQRFPRGHHLTTQYSINELFGGNGDDRVPWWLAGGRKIPNVSGFRVPDYAYFADRVRRKTGLSFVGSFNAENDGLARRFGVTVDMRFVPTSKVKPDTGSAWHGVEITEQTPLPFAFVLKRDVTAFKLIKGKDEARPAEPLPRRAVVPLSGNARIKAGHRYYQTLGNKTRWLKGSELGIVAPPKAWPEAAEKGEKWIDISLTQQTLVLYEGKRAWYATLASTGRDRLGDPKTSLATPQGTFRIRSKHVAAVMDSEENSSVAGGTRANAKKHGGGGGATAERLRQAQASGETLSDEDQRRLKNIEKGRDPEYGVTRRRGALGFELRDVPWIQFFAAGYAIHGAYWHDVFGIPRSHGCVNLSPIDARVVFLWTDPPLPESWHGLNAAEPFKNGTTVVIRE